MLLKIPKINNSTKKVLKKVILSIFAILTTSILVSPAFAQSGYTLSATIVDAATGEGMPGAVIELIPASGGQTRALTSGYEGAVRVTGLARGKYTFRVTFLGYETPDRTVDLTKSINLGRIELSEANVQIEQIVKEVQAMRTSQRGDTVAYNADAFKVTADADVEGLLKKMPGLTITDGQVEAQGEAVQKVFVDGKEFFGDDVASAIKSIPAQAVAQVEVYDKLSDQAEFSGVDDGQGYKAINIVTKPGMQQGVFGKVYAGYGYDPHPEDQPYHKYIAGGNVNWFRGSSRLSLIGLVNNINQQNFSFEDIVGATGGGATGGRGGGGFQRGMGQYMVRPQSGVASAEAIGINYSDEWGKRKQITFQGSYFFNHTRTTDFNGTERWYEEPAPIDTLLTEGHSVTSNNNHRINARFEWKISDSQSLMIRPGVSFQSNDPLSTLVGRQFGQSGYSLIDNFDDSFREAIDVRTSAIYRVRIVKPGRTLTVHGNLRYRDSKSERNTYSNDAPPVSSILDPSNVAANLIYQRTHNPSGRRRIGGHVTYTEPISPASQLSLNYEAQFEREHNDRLGYLTGDTFDITGLTPDPLLSNNVVSRYSTHAIGPGYNYAKDKSTLSANVSYQHSRMRGTIGSGSVDHAFENVTYRVRGQLYFNNENSLRVRIYSYTDDPDVEQLQEIYDLSNAQYISRGNPGLKPEYTHYANLQYIRSHVEKGQTLQVSVGGRITQSYISQHVTYNPTLTIEGVEYKPLQFSEPVNLNGYWQVNSQISYGFPVKFVRSNLNLFAGVAYTSIPTLVDTQRNRANNMGYNGGVVLGSNISENVDFTVAWNGMYNQAKNSLGRGDNNYFYHSASANFKFVLPLGFSVAGAAAYSQYVGFTNKYDDNFLLCNFSVGKKVFKQLGEISIGVNDIFDQNTAFARTTGSGYTQNSWNSAIGRMFVVQFTYNLRVFGS